MIILVADKLDAHAIQDLESSGFQLVFTQGLATGNLPAEATQCEILVVRSSRVTASILTKLPDLKLIIRAGSGVDTIDLEAALARQIQVSNCPGKNADAVAEMALALLLAVDRKVAEGTIALRQGRWTKGPLGQAMGLKGRVLGLVGFGAVGQALARKARGLEMDVVVWTHSPMIDSVSTFAMGLGIRQAGSLLELAQASDAVSIHVAATAETRNLIGGEFLASLRPGAIFINTARGEIVDRNALVDAIHSRGLRVGLDVFSGEPKVPEAAFGDPELAALATCTPHLGASTDQAVAAVADEVVRIVREFRKTGQAPNDVLAERISI